jgi:hypothetical protein
MDPEEHWGGVVIVQLSPTLALRSEGSESVPVLVIANDSHAYRAQELVIIWRIGTTGASLVARFGRLQKGGARRCCEKFLAQWPEGPQLEGEA